MPKLYRPAVQERRIRALIFGKSGVGKTDLSFQGPNPVLFPAEGRFENFIGNARFTNPDGSCRFQVLAIDDNRLVDEYKTSLEMAMNGAFGPGTFVIDSATVVEKSQRALQDYKTDADNANVRRQALGARREDLEDVLLDPLAGTSAMHIIMTAHQANVFGGDNSVSDAKPDLTRNAEHYVDLVVQLFFDEDPQTKARRGPRKAKIYKSAFEHIHPRGKIIENPTWENVFDPIIKVGTGSTTQPTPANAAPPADAPKAPSTKALFARWKQAGEPEGSFWAWCQAAGIATELDLDGKRGIPDPAARITAAEKLEALPIVAETHAA